ncbi:MAG: hypothetical protein KatS3mg082_2676 [Nitrospiraceae bacterium]|nr:MAG: hypothetical protein KatS3mg082_2676 [Nitrospiraceae bacterium]
MRLPAGGGHEVGERGAFGPAQEFEDDGLLRAFARGLRRLLGLACLAALACSARRRPSVAPAVGVRAWTARQIRATAVLRSVNFFTGLRSPKGGTPAKPFQISTSRSAGQLAASFASSFSLEKRAWPSGIASPAR